MNMNKQMVVTKVEKANSEKAKYFWSSYKITLSNLVIYLNQHFCTRGEYNIHYYQGNRSCYQSCTVKDFQQIVKYPNGVLQNASYKKTFTVVLKVKIEKE